MKKEEFVVGKWYHYSGWYIKYSGHSKSGVWIGSEEINSSQKYNDRIGHFGSGNDHEKTLVSDISIIIDFLPDNHPDKLEYLNTKGGNDLFINLL